MEDLIKAFQIFLKYDNPEWPTHCEHDIMFVCIDPDKVPEEAKEELEKLGFTAAKNHDQGGDCFYSFKYGSA